MFAKVYRDETRFENQEAREASSSMGIFVDIFHMTSSIQINAFVQNKSELHQLHRKELIYITLLPLLSLIKGSLDNSSKLVVLLYT